MALELTLLLPPLDASASSLPTIEILLARADRQPAARHDALVLSLFGLSPHIGTAALALLGDGGAPSDSHWLRADPIQLVADRDRVVIQPTEPPSSDESEAILAALRAYFADEGWTWESPRPGRWYLRHPGPPPPPMPSVTEVLGSDLRRWLPPGREALQWSARLNEMQMLLFGLDLNAQREAAGIPPINGLWLWGYGALPDPIASPYATIFADSALLHGLALLAGKVPRAVPETLAKLGGCESALVDLRHDHDWAGLEARWFVPLREAMRKGQVSAAHIVYDGSAFDVRPGQRWRWWKRPRPLEAWRT